MKNEDVEFVLAHFDSFFADSLSSATRCGIPFMIGNFALQFEHFKESFSI